MGVGGSHDFGIEHAWNLYIPGINGLATGLGISVDTAYSPFSDMVVGHLRDIGIDVKHALFFEIFIGSYPQIAHVLCPSLALPVFRRLPEWLWMLRIGPAPAQVATQGLPDLLFLGIGVLVQQGLGRGDKPRRAVTALHAVVLHIGLHQRMTGVGDPLRRLNTVLPSHSMASVIQDRIGLPSMITVHDPQAPRSQNILGEVSPSLSWIR